MRVSFRSLFAVVALLAAVCAGTASAAVSGKYVPRMSSLVDGGDGYLYGVVNYQDKKAPSSGLPVRVYKFGKDDLKAVEYVELSSEGDRNTGYDAMLGYGDIGKVIAVRDGKLYVTTTYRGNAGGKDVEPGGLLFEVDTKTMAATLKAYGKNSIGNDIRLGSIAVTADGTLFVTGAQQGGVGPFLYKADISALDKSYPTNQAGVFTAIGLKGSSNVGAVWNADEKFLMTSGGTGYRGSLDVSLDIREGTGFDPAKASFTDTGTGDLKGSVASYAPLSITNNSDQIVAIVVTDRYEGDAWKHAVSTIKKSGGDYKLSAQKDEFCEGDDNSTKVFALGNNRALVVNKADAKIFGYLFEEADLKADSSLTPLGAKQLPLPEGSDVEDVILVGDYIYVSANASEEPSKIYKIALSDLTSVAATTDLKEWPEGVVPVSPALPREQEDDKYDPDLNIRSLTTPSSSYTKIDDALNMIKSDNFKAADFALEEGMVVLKSDDSAIKLTVGLVLSDDADLQPTDPDTRLDLLSLKLTPLPVVQKEVTQLRQPSGVQNTVVLSFEIDGRTLSANSRNGRVLLYKISDGTGAKAAVRLSQVDKLAQIKDGAFMVTYNTGPAAGQDDPNAPMQIGDAISDDVTYTINVAIKDDGDYDLCKDSGQTIKNVVDPLVLASVSTTKDEPYGPVVPPCTDGAGSCDTGFALFAAAAAAATMIARKRR